MVAWPVVTVGTAPVAVVGAGAVLAALGALAAVGEGAVEVADGGGGVPAGAGVRVAGGGTVDTADGGWPQTASNVVAGGKGALAGPPAPHFQPCRSPSSARALNAPSAE
jgi:hypothetical protein